MKPAWLMRFMNWTGRDIMILEDEEVMIVERERVQRNLFILTIHLLLANHFGTIEAISY